MSYSNLQSSLISNFDSWYSKTDNQEKLKRLSINQKDALNRLLLAESVGEPSFHLRADNIDDLSIFDFQLNRIASEILNSKLGSEIPPKTSKPCVNFFNQNLSLIEEGVLLNSLNSDGYCLSPIALTQAQLLELKKGLKSHKFVTKGNQPNELNGEQLLEFIQKNTSPPVQDGDTYWLEDMNELIQDPLFVKLAFDPYIISIASRYLGCVPIHVQTNAWFSFPGEVSKNNLSMNGQLFHQDKEFIKFFKVFIYLSDVGADQGPHCYIAGSHLDELHHKGIPISARVTDEDIGKYYETSRIKTVEGSAGSILFGDTSCVHKGYSVKSGGRIMLQLEYASSLYLSPVSPFRDLEDVEGTLLQYSKNVSDRLILNYNSLLREKFNTFSFQSNKKSLKTKLRILASKVKKWILHLVK